MLTNFFLVVAFVIACFIENGMCRTYQTIGSITICETRFSNGYGSGTAFTGTYQISGNANDIVTGAYLPFTNDNDHDQTFTYDDNLNQYGFFDDSTGNALLFNDAGTLARRAIRNIIDHAVYGSSCTCSEPIEEVGQRMEVSGPNLDDRNVNKLSICATIVEKEDPTVYPDNVILEDWQCNPATMYQCNKLQQLLNVEYLGFEVFFDPDFCKNDGQIVLSDLDINQGRWRCKKCDNGYQQFRLNDEDDDEAIDVRKCLLFTDYFEHCTDGSFDSDRGCTDCDEGFWLREHPFDYVNEYCPFGFCVNETEYLSTGNEQAQGNPDPTDGFEISDFDENDEVYRLCRNQSERSNAASQNMTQHHGIDYIGVVDPFDTLQCLVRSHSNEEDYCTDEDFCLQKQQCQQDGSCSQCEEDFDKFSNWHPCQPITDFGEACVSVTPHHGCSQCRASTNGHGYEAAYDEYNQVWYCIALDGIVETPAPHTTLNHVPSKWMCPQKCGESVYQYDPYKSLTIFDIDDRKYCDCGCKIGDDACPDTEDEPYFCHATDCHEGAGCDQCLFEDDFGEYFKLTHEHPCVNCKEYLGEHCKFCASHQGCQQCDDNWSLKFDECCGMWYCA